MILVAFALYCISVAANGNYCCCVLVILLACHKMLYENHQFQRSTPWRRMTSSVVWLLFRAAINFPPKLLSILRQTMSRKSQNKCHSTWVEFKWHGRYWQVLFFFFVVFLEKTTWKIILRKHYFDLNVGLFMYYEIIFKVMNRSRNYGKNCETRISKRRVTVLKYFLKIRNMYEL